jgi:hypothetical protein
LDEIDVIKSAIYHINEAKKGIENTFGNVSSPDSQAELERAYQTLEDSLRHCRGVFGTSSSRQMQ